MKLPKAPDGYVLPFAYNHQRPYRLYFKPKGAMHHQSVVYRIRGRSQSTVAFHISEKLLGIVSI